MLPHLTLSPQPHPTHHLQGEQWKRTTLRTALAFPGFVSAIFLTLNFLVWGQKSSGAVPFGTLCALVFLWCGISVPLCFVGSYFGYKKPAHEVRREQACVGRVWSQKCRQSGCDPCPPPLTQDPVRTNKIPRQIPEQPWYMHPAFSILIGGILPFGAVFIELFFILTSMWMHQFYYLFGFLALVFIILIITCAEITIVLAYFQLCSGGAAGWSGAQRGCAAELVHSGCPHATFTPPCAPLSQRTTTGGGAPT